MFDVSVQLESERGAANLIPKANGRRHPDLVSPRDAGKHVRH